MAQYDDLNARQIWAVGIVSAALTAVTILAVQVLYYALLNRHNDVKLAGSEYSTSNAYLAAEAEQINRYGRNPETGAVQIPIDRAMTLVVERNARSAGAESRREASAEPTPRSRAGAARSESAVQPAPAESNEAPAEGSEEPAEQPAAGSSDEPVAEPSGEPAAEPSDEPVAESSDEPATEPSEESDEPNAGDDES